MLVLKILDFAPLLLKILLDHKLQMYAYLLMWAKSFQSCPTLCDPMDCSPPGSSVHGILQARMLEWAAMPSSRGSSWPRDQTHVSYVSWVSNIHRQVLYHQCHLGSPFLFISYTYILLDLYIHYKKDTKKWEKNDLRIKINLKQTSKNPSLPSILKYYFVYSIRQAWSLENI